VGVPVEVGDSVGLAVSVRVGLRVELASLCERARPRRGARLRLRLGRVVVALGVRVADPVEVMLCVWLAVCVCEEVADSVDDSVCDGVAVVVLLCVSVQVSLGVAVTEGLRVTVAVCVALGEIDCVREAVSVLLGDCVWRSGQRLARSSCLAVRGR